MSYSSLWTIDKDWDGKEHTTYRNSHLFAPIVWDILMCKYIPKEERKLTYSRTLDGKTVEYETSYMIWAMSIFKPNNNSKKLNEIINNCQEQFDRVLWELSRSSVFNAKDKDYVAKCIKQFVEKNFNWLDIEDNAHIKERFLKLARDIRELPTECNYFVLKGTSCDDNVEYWFSCDDGNKKLSDWDKFVCEFTLIENETVVDFSDNLTMCKKD